MTQAEIRIAFETAGRDLVAIALDATGEVPSGLETTIIAGDADYLDECAVALGYEDGMPGGYPAACQEWVAVFDGVREALAEVSL